MSWQTEEYYEGLLYDPSQAQRAMQMLREMWIDVEELPQTQNSLSVATQSLTIISSTASSESRQIRSSERTF